MLLSLDDFESAARAALPEMVWGYYVGGSDDEVALRSNRSSWDEVKLAYRVLVDVASVDTRTELFGFELAAPVAVAPTAFHRLAHPEGEVETARGVSAAGTAMALSTLSTRRIEDVEAELPAGALWHQLYVFRDRGAARALVEHAEEAGCRAVLLTVDAPRLGRRERDVRNRFHLPPEIVIENALDAARGIGVEEADSGLAAWVASQLDDSLTWRDLEALCSWTSLPVLVKGVVRPDDAVRAMEHGAAGVVVSNHGGRQLDASPPTAAVLPHVADALAGLSLPSRLLVDGGIRRGADVVRALALGADAALVGRPVLWGLAVDGAAGVERVLGILRDEIELTMALCGANRPTEVGADLIWRP